jgi:hypothetical protein
MPAAIPAAISLGGAALGALGKGKKQGSQTNEFQNTQETNTQQSQNSSYNNQSNSTITPNEDPMFAAFRQMLLPVLADEYQKAQKPLYGDAEKAQFLGEQNALSEAGAKALDSRLARRGALRSGALDMGLGDLEAARQRSTTGFFSQLPFLNEQARSQRTNNLLGMATSFLGRAPVGQTTSGSQSGTAESSAQGKSTQTGSGTSTGANFGPSFGAAFLPQLGGAISSNAAGIAGKLFGKGSGGNYTNEQIANGWGNGG